MSPTKQVETKSKTTTEDGEDIARRNFKQQLVNKKQMKTDNVQSLKAHAYVPLRFCIINKLFQM